MGLAGTLIDLQLSFHQYAMILFFNYTAPRFTAAPTLWRDTLLTAVKGPYI
jgi:hypothetical protein